MTLFHALGHMVVVLAALNAKAIVGILAAVCAVATILIILAGVPLVYIMVALPRWGSSSCQ